MECKDSRSNHQNPRREALALARVRFSMAEKSIMEERRTKHQYATYGASHDQETTWKMLYRGEATQRCTAPSQSDRRRRRWRQWRLGLATSLLSTQCMAVVLPQQLLNLSMQRGFVLQSTNYSMEEWFFPIIRKSKDYPKSSCLILNLRCMQMIYFIILHPISLIIGNLNKT